MAEEVRGFFNVPVVKGDGVEIEDFLGRATVEFNADGTSTVSMKLSKNFTEFVKRGTLRQLSVNAMVLMGK